jgi:hypothetical protein
MTTRAATGQLIVRRDNTVNFSLSPHAMSAATQNEFNHHIAIKLSRVLNIVNPNDLLAQRVTDIAKANTLLGFISGSNCCLFCL